MIIGQTTRFVHAMVGQILQPGEVAVDATLGNGHDTLFLANHVGPQGRVHGFDIQESALASAGKRLEEAGVASHVVLHHAGHETMLEALPELAGKVGAVMFNLGYLPGSDGVVITQSETTCRAIDASLGLLRSGGVLSMILYTGHSGGMEEAIAVQEHLKVIPTTQAQVMLCNMHNHNDPKVRVALLQKK